MLHNVSLTNFSSFSSIVSRDGGYFDLMVNGGGAVVIEFRREPFVTQQKAVRTPWNEIVLIDPIELVLENPVSSSSNDDKDQDQSSCLPHSYRNMIPQIVSAPKSSLSKISNKLEGVSNQHISRAIILRDSALAQYAIPLPGGAFSMP